MTVCKKPEGRLISYSIKSAGGMLGSVIKTNVRLSKDGTCALIFNGRQNSWQPIWQASYMRLTVK